MLITSHYMCSALIFASAAMLFSCIKSLASVEVDAAARASGSMSKS
jgi:hypothetical protein